MTSSTPVYGSWKICIAPSCAICVMPFSNCLRFMVSIRSTEAKCSGAKVGMPLEFHAHAGFAYSVADGEDAGVEHADDVPGVGLVDYRALLRHELLRLRRRSVFPPCTW